MHVTHSPDDPAAAPIAFEDFLKVDMSLVRNVHLHPIKRELIATFRRFSERTGITLVAEGVENEAQLGFLRKQQCDHIQGFFYSKALPYPDLENFLASSDDGTKENETLPS